jgi:hypothetical protein
MMMMLIAGVVPPNERSQALFGRDACAEERPNVNEIKQASDAHTKGEGYNEVGQVLG